MASLRWTLGARQDLREIVEYIAQDSEAYAAAVAGRITAAIERLPRHPRLGRVVPEYTDESIREIIVGNYRIVYQLRGPLIGIAAVVHGSRDLLRLLDQDPGRFVFS
jgi:plasmid stabilization system protein ParE